MNPDYKPVPKVKAVAISGGTVTAILAVLAILGVDDVTPEDVVSVSTAGLAVITGLTTIVNFIAGYFKRS